MIVAIDGATAISRIAMTAIPMTMATIVYPSIPRVSASPCLRVG